MSLECSIAPETHPEWKAGKGVVLCKSCDQKEYVLVEEDVDFADNNYIEPEKVSVIQSKKDDDVDLL